MHDPELQVGISFADVVINLQSSGMVHPTLLLFDTQDDYNCYIEAVESYTRNSITKSCDWLDDVDKVFEFVTDYKFTDKDFIVKATPHGEFAAVLDNTGWYQSVNNLMYGVFDDAVISYEL